jgi:hypothetical protein
LPRNVSALRAIRAVWPEGEAIGLVASAAASGLPKPPAMTAAAQSSIVSDKDDFMNFWWSQFLP